MINSLMLTWLAGENALVSCLPSWPRMKERSLSRQAAQLASVRRNRPQCEHYEDLEWIPR
jgi:hypothetical protein